MSDNVNFTVDFTPHGDYTPYSGEGSSDLINFDGLCVVTIASGKPYMSKAKDGQPSKPMVKLSLVIQDEDAKGLRLISDVHCGGVDRNGKDMSRQLMDVLVSAGIELTFIHENAKKQTKAGINELLAQLENRTGHVEIEADTYDGKPTTKVKNWVTKERYEQDLSVGRHRRPRRNVGVQTAIGAGSSISLGGPGAAIGTNGQAAAAGASLGGF